MARRALTLYADPGGSQHRVVQHHEQQLGQRDPFDAPYRCVLLLLYGLAQYRYCLGIAFVADILGRDQPL